MQPPFARLHQLAIIRQASALNRRYIGFLSWSILYVCCLRSHSYVMTVPTTPMAYWRPLTIVDARELRPRTGRRGLGPVTSCSRFLRAVSA